ncbi:hypothetical protein C8K18_12023 [Paraburkholderia sp. GV068]|jgi:hypothetical protein|uniref:Lipoprotein n=1 Tax=Paraburkholderia graminis (strain ATCC 700544 / DSM 17151 / LMG 18924 / NCIMB 13744 / C4D1M) TaxID=396598 RepID=B1FV70_PARG4|nr:MULTISPECIES: hypothetical protein [Paraburkholderia]ALE57926.1 hypothetical protein AC233_25925 [Burkholderia sp. HB1]AXF12087.1 hypothetical protein CUJ91_30295 [Paraburkholderia graminis]EDT12379.1 hypothetical protein BgramDRAFT_0943 [Paraburkholderia graminis C4D1M]MDR6470838.1 hypothetical protein [Paraburkholderia graminis]MDR6476779.1 hypothetical protein [Paraburkholderia graminis]
MNRSFSFLARYLGLMLAVSAGAALGGCGSSAPLFLSDGRPTTLVECPAGSDSCAQQAAASCSGGAFDTVRQSTSNGTLSLIYACRAK